MNHERLVITSWLQLPAPQVSRRRFARLGRQPGDASSLDELDNVVDPSAPNRQHRRERVTDAPDALSGGSGDEVVVAIPFRLTRRIGDQLEDWHVMTSNQTGSTDDRGLPVVAHALTLVVRRGG